MQTLVEVPESTRQVMPLSSKSVGYPQILESRYPDSKFTIRFSPRQHTTHSHYPGLPTAWVA